jgi:hypothetical protein
MIDETMKIPEPIIDPATSMVESNNPSPLTSFSSATGASVTALAISNPLDWRRVNHQPGVSSNAKKLRKSFYGKKEACNLPATDDLKSSAARTTLAVGLRRCPGLGHRIGCHIAWRSRADSAAV